MKSIAPFLLAAIFGSCYAESADAQLFRSCPLFGRQSPACGPCGRAGLQQHFPPCESFSTYGSPSVHFDQCIEPICFSHQAPQYPACPPVCYDGHGCYGGSIHQTQTSLSGGQMISEYLSSTYSDPSQLTPEQSLSVQISALEDLLGQVRSKLNRIQQEDGMNPAPSLNDIKQAIEGSETDSDNAPGDGNGGASNNNLPFRTWVDNTGKYSTEAVLLSCSKDTVMLMKRNGEKKTVPLERLSQHDLRLVNAFRGIRIVNAIEQLLNRG